MYFDVRKIILYKDNSSFWLSGCSINGYLWEPGKGEPWYYGCPFVLCPLQAQCPKKQVSTLAISWHPSSKNKGMDVKIQMENFND